MTSRTRRLLGCLFLLIIGGHFLDSSLFATAYYVSKEGLDSHPGTKKQPWRTPARAAKAVVPGDTVVILGGTYFQWPPCAFDRSGTPGAPITITGESGASILNGLQVGGDYYRILNLSIGTTNEPLYRYMFQVLGNHNLTSNCAVSFSFPGMHDVKGLAVYGTNNVVTDCSFVNFLNSTAVAIGGESNLVTHSIVGNSWNLKAFVVFGQGNTISHNLVTNILYRRFPGHDQHPDFVQSFGDNAGLSGSNFLADANYVVNCEGGMHMFYLSIDNPVSFGKFDGFTFRNNIFINAGNSGDSGYPHTRICNNLFYHCAQNQGQAIQFFGDPKKLGVASNSLCMNNIFIDCGRDPTSSRAGYVEDDGAPGVIVDYNYVCNLNFRAVDSSIWGRNFGPHTINGGDPGFINMSRGDFHLAPTSILRAAGTNLSALFSDDCVGARRPTKGPWPIGPYTSD